MLCVRDFYQTQISHVRFSLVETQPDKVVVKINVFESISERKVYDVAL